MASRWIALRAGRWFGVDLYIGTTMLLLFGVALAWNSWSFFTMPEAERPPVFEAYAPLIALSALIGCTLLHEIGHALAAAWRRIRPRAIMLSFMGVTHFHRAAIKPNDEWLIALAGPAVNVTIGAALLPFMIPAADVLRAGEFGVLFISFEGLLAVVGMANFVIAAINLAPLFPMDGGRVVVGVLSRFMERDQALRAVARASLIVAVLALAGVLADLAFADWWIEDWHVAVVLIGYVTMMASLRAMNAPRT